MTACPSCGAALAEGAVQCRSCRRVFGEDNRCPHCDAFAVARWNGLELSCSACGKPRERKPKTVVIEEKGGSGELLTAKAGSFALRAAGVAGFALAGTSLFGGIVASTMGADPLPVMLSTGFVALLSGATGFFAWRRGGAAGKRVDERERASAEIRVLALAEERGGVLRVTDVVRGLGMASHEAEALLTSLVDGARVTLELDEQGLLAYHFHEVKSPRVAPPKVRVDTSGAPAEDEDVAARGNDVTRKNQA